MRKPMADAEMAIQALRDIPPTPDGRWEWIPRRMAIDVVERALAEARIAAMWDERQDDAEAGADPKETHK